MYQRRITTLSISIVAVMLLSMIAACAGPAATSTEESPAQTESAEGAGEPITLRMWVHSNPHYKKMAETYAAEYENETGTKIVLDFLPWEEYGSKAVAAFAGGNEPDILEAVASWLYGQKIAGQLDPLPEDLAANIETRFHQASLPPVEYNGTYYGLPLNVNIDAGPLFVANKALYDEAGVTPKWDNWDAYIADLQKLTQSEGDVITRSGVTIAGGDLMIQFLMYFLQAGGTFYGPDEKSVTINNEYGKIALQTLYDYLYTYKVDSTDLGDFMGVATGTSAGTFYGPWYTKIMDDDFPEVEWVWAETPSLPDGVGPYFPSANVWTWTVSANSPNKEAAWDFIRWLDDNQRRVDWAVETGEIPAVVELWENSDIADSKRFGPWLPYLEYQVPLLHIGPQDEYSNILNNMVSSVLFQEATVDEALAKAEQDLNDFLARSVQ